MVYSPPVGGISVASEETGPTVGGEHLGRLEITLDDQGRVAISLPITLPHSLSGEEHPGALPLATGNATSGGGSSTARRAYFGFTASTGEASEKHDILSAAFCHRVGCAAL